KCTAAKFRAAGRQAVCGLGCAAKGTLTAHAIDPCLAACTATFMKACAKSETKDDCHTTGDCVAAAAIVDALVTDAANALPSTPTTTSTTSSTSSTSSSSTTTVTTPTTTPTMPTD